MDIRRSIRVRMLAGVILGATLAVGGCGDDGTTPGFTADGEVDGVLFLDRNENGAYDAFGVDGLLPGVRVAARSGADGSVAVGVETGQHGEFRLILPAGLHRLEFEEMDLDEGLSVCPNPVTVRIYARDITVQRVAVRSVC